MRNLAARLTRIEQQHTAETNTITTMYDGPPMTDAEIDAYNRIRRLDQPQIITLRIDRPNGHDEP